MKGNTLIGKKKTFRKKNENDEILVRKYFILLYLKVMAITLLSCS